MKPRKASFAASLVALACLASSGSAQPTVPDEFGTQDGIDLWIPATAFVGIDGVAWTIGLGPLLYWSSTTSGSFYATLSLPQGAYLDSWRAFYYDNSNSHDLTVEFDKWYDDITSSPSSQGIVVSSFSSSGTPGQANHHQVENLTIDYREPSGPGITRNQAADFYTFSVGVPADDQLGFKGIRVFWHRQVSPAPATATFNDVPTTDPGFQYIEALVASGITAGCNAAPLMYCPDATLTRRQMAVFLAKALGLHWPPF